MASNIGPTMASNIGPAMVFKIGLTIAYDDRRSIGSRSDPTNGYLHRPRVWLNKWMNMHKMIMGIAFILLYNKSLFNIFPN